jgi:cell division protein FtsL
MPRAANRKTEAYLGLSVAGGQVVRQADYVYGIVPERGEYGLEVQPDQGDQALLTRVQTLASSFQWNATNATTNEDVVAIAVDRSHPPLIARFGTDPRDPNGRLSICMRVWITSSAEPLEQMIADVWPDSVRLPTTQAEFLSVALQQKSGRIVVGPSNSFSAVGFDSSWGVSRVMPDASHVGGNPKFTARPSSSTTNRVSQSPGKSFSLLKMFSTLMAFALLATVVFAVIQYSETEKLRANTRSLVKDKSEAQRNAVELQRQIDEEAKARRQRSIEIEAKTRELTQELTELRSELQRQKDRVGDLESAVKASPGKVDQADLLSLRAFKDAVERYINSQGRSLQELKNAVPQSLSRVEERTDKVKETSQGKSNNK